MLRSTIINCLSVSDKERARKIKNDQANNGLTGFARYLIVMKTFWPNMEYEEATLGNIKLS